MDPPRTSSDPVVADTSKATESSQPVAETTPAGVLPSAPASTPGRRIVRLGLALGALAIIAGSCWHFGRLWWASRHFRSAQTAINQFRYDEAKNHLVICHSIWPDDPALLILAARVARRLGNHDDARQFLDRYHELRGNDDDLTLERILLRAEKGELDAVSAFCIALLDRKHSQSPVILEALIASNLRLLRFSEAAGAAKYWQDYAPVQPQPWYWQGYLHDLQAHTQDAIEAYRKAVALDPDYVEARVRLASNLLQLAQAREALPHLEHVLSLRPGHAAARVELARCLDQLGRQSEAEQTLDAVLAEYPDFQPALQQRGLLAMRQGHTTQAEPWLRRSYELAPSNTETLYQYSLCLQRNGKPSESRAVQERLKALETDLRRLTEITSDRLPKAPHDPDLLCEIGKITLRVGARSEGLRWLEAALRVNPRHAPTHEAYVVYYRAIGQLGLAEKHLQFLSAK